MDWLKALALPQSAGQIEVLGYASMMVHTLFMIFSSLLLWGTLLSMYLKKKEKRDLDGRCGRLSKEIMNIVLFNKTTGILFSLLPLATIIFIFAQLFQTQNNQNLSYLAYAIVLLFLSLLLIYSYKNSLNDFKSADFHSGFFGSLLLFFSLWLFTSALASSVFIPLSQGGESNVTLFSSTTLLEFLLFLCVAVTISGAAILYGIFNVQQTDPNADEDYTELVKSVSVKSALGAVLFIPALIIADLVLQPKTSLTGTLFFSTTLGLILLFVVYHLLYSLYKKIEKNIVGVLLVTLVLFVVTCVVNSQLLMAASNRTNFVILAADHDMYVADLKGTNAAPVYNGEDIYMGRCAACHTFDKKFIGPPHDEVVPKYFGKEDQLISFIRNPVKINPAYPPMPNPGLKPDEIKAVADYLLAKVKQDTEKKK